VLVRQEHLAGVEVLQTTELVLPPIDPDHAAVRDEQLAKFRSRNDAAARRENATGPGIANILE
jgi:hypothetical protein